jgi:hypothetical protein
MTKSKIVKKKGGCGCQNSIKGGASFDVNNPSVNPINNYNADPSDPSQLMSVRIQPNMNVPFLSGGKKRTTKRSKRSKTSKKSKHRKTIKRRTMRLKKGGADPILSSQNANIVSSFNSTLGAQTSANIITGTNDEIINSGMKTNPEMPFI